MVLLGLIIDKTRGPAYREMAVASKKKILGNSPQSAYFVLDGDKTNLAEEPLP